MSPYLGISGVEAKEIAHAEAQRRREENAFVFFAPLRELFFEGAEFREIFSCTRSFVRYNHVQLDVNGRKALSCPNDRH